MAKANKNNDSNPRYSDSDEFRKDDHVRWQFGVPREGHANFTWVRHFIHHVAPAGPGAASGEASFVLANGRMSSNQLGEGNIRRARPGQFFYSTQSPDTLARAAGL